VNLSDNYDNDDSNATIRAKFEPYHWKGHEKREERNVRIADFICSSVRHRNGVPVFCGRQLYFY